MSIGNSMKREHGNRPCTQEKHKNFTIGGMCFLAYMGCHIGKNILASLMPQIIAAVPDSAVTLGSMTSVFLLTYGIGQLINGVIGTFIPAKWLVSAGLIVSGGIIILIPVFNFGFLCTVLWGICGFSSSMLWGPISAMVGDNTKPKAAKALLTALTAASLLGALTTYIIAFFASHSDNWKPFFSSAGIIMICIAALWLPVCTLMERKGMIVGTSRRPERSESPKENRRRKKPGNPGLVRTFFSVGFVSMMIVAMLNGVIRNATSLWVPTFLSQYLNIQLSSVSLISSVLPFVCISGTFLSLYLLKLFRDNEKAECLALFAFSGICFGLILIFRSVSTPLALISLFLAMAGMNGACNMIFSAYVLRFGRFGIISGMSGFLDFASYMSAAAASALFTALVNNDNWGGVVISWTLCCALGVVFSVIAVITGKNGTPLPPENSENIEAFSD